MIEKEPTPYPLRTENICDVVCEPTAGYGKPVVYQGTTITNALKDYYTFTTNHEKVDVLKWIVAFAFERNSNLKELILFKGSRLISVERELCESAYFEK